MTDRRLRTIALLARPPGLLVLRDALLDNPLLDVVAVYTHGRLPRAAGGGPRVEVAGFAELCEDHGTPLQIVDAGDARDIGPSLPDSQLDLLVSLSWRYVVPAAILSRFRRGCINVHRGALPRFAGAEPVLRAIEAGERRVAITAHEMIEEIDAGRTIAEVWCDIGSHLAGGDPAVQAERVKRALEPLYAPLVRLAVEARVVDAGG